MSLVKIEKRTVSSSYRVFAWTKDLACEVLSSVHGISQTEQRLVTNNSSSIVAIVIVNYYFHAQDIYAYFTLFIKTGTLDQ